MEDDGKDRAPDASAAQRAAAVRLRNMLDQKTGHEKHVLRRYVLVLERKIRTGK